MTITKEAITHLINADKKEIERLEGRRTEELGNSINFVENELQIQYLTGRVSGLEAAIADE